ncbi:MAG TPA: hypothetical protein G4O12_06440 [Dehalococcoidia bacterium]|nr:hypothetical protein [Dehalococcoidia bacterium]
MITNKRRKDTRTLIKEIFIEHPDWNARQIYDRYLILIGDANNAVTLNAVQKHIEYLKDINKQWQEKGLDNLWHLGLMEKYPAIIPEAVLHILAVQAWAKRTQHEAVTVGQAIWISRLYTCISNTELTGKRKERDAALRWLWHWSRAYAIEEKLSFIAKIPPDTTNLDTALSDFAGIEVFPDYAYFIGTKDGKMIDGPGLWAKIQKDTLEYRKGEKEAENEGTHSKEIKE